jgi:hypothetical protein
MYRGDLCRPCSRLFSSSPPPRVFKVVGNEIACNYERGVSFEKPKKVKIDLRGVPRRGRHLETARAIAVSITLSIDVRNRGDLKLGFLLTHTGLTQTWLS